MSTPPRWVDRSSNVIPLDSVSALARTRLQEATLYAAEAEKEAEVSRDQAARLTVIADRAAAQRDYWARIAEISEAVDLRLSVEGDVEVSGAIPPAAAPPAPTEQGPPF